MSIKTWQERQAATGIGSIEARDDEIDELRAALQERDALDEVKELRHQLEIARGYIKALSEEIIKLREKKPLAQPEQEPVAWITEWEGKYSSGKILDYIAHTRGGKVEYTPLYTTPPQRTWVGLTDEERENFKGLGLIGIELVEAKLKEKNK